MNKSIKINAINLPHLAGRITVPGYDRSVIKTGILHIGPGAFHRSHQAYYIDQILGESGTKDWGICDVGLLDTDIRIINALKEQDGLYTLMINEPDGSLRARIIGSIVQYLFAPENPGAVISKIADPDIKIITLTITEGGYNFDTYTGEFQINEPSIQWDLKYPDNPRTVFGYLTRGLKHRKSRGIAGVTIQSCDNIQKNGDLLKKMLISYVRQAEPELVSWIEKHVTFPNSMVDRITPSTRQSDIETLKSAFGIEDVWPVVCEPYIQWVIEDNYSNGRPCLESAGVQFASDVSPYEKMKIRLLNAGHSLLGFCGALYGYEFIHEAVNNSTFAKFLRYFMDDEVTPILDEVPGIDLDLYKDTLLERFGNACIKDQVSRICFQSSAKIPKFLLPTINEQLLKDGHIKCSALIIAAWCRYCEGKDEAGNNYNIEDEMIPVLKEKALLSHHDPLAFLQINTIFGDLINSGIFTRTYINALRILYDNGIIAGINELILND